MKTGNERCRLVTASKELIDDLISKDTHNRVKRKSHIDYLRKEIRENRWCITNQGIGVTESGYIADGGHRLEAIKQEGYPPVQFFLIEGLSDEAQKYIDQHTRRRMGDVLELFFDHSISAQIIAALTVLWKQEMGWSSPKPSPDEMIGRLQQYSTEVRIMVQVDRSRRIAAPIFAAFLEEYHATQNSRVLDFMGQVITGEFIGEGDPAYTLRRWLESTRGACGGSLVQQERFLKAKSAIKAFLENRKLTRLYAFGEKQTDANEKAAA